MTRIKKPSDNGPRLHLYVQVGLLGAFMGPLYLLLLASPASLWSELFQSFVRHDGTRWFVFFAVANLIASVVLVRFGALRLRPFNVVVGDAALFIGVFVFIAVMFGCYPITAYELAGTAGATNLFTAVESYLLTVIWAAGTASFIVLLESYLILPLIVIQLALYGAMYKRNTLGTPRVVV